MLRIKEEKTHEYRNNQPDSGQSAHLLLSRDRLPCDEGSRLRWEMDRVDTNIGCGFVKSQPRIDPTHLIPLI